MDIQKKIPISREILADMETPLSVYRKLANCSYSYLFESVEGGDKWARYSLIGLKARRLIKVVKNEVVILQDGKQIETITIDDPLDYLDQLQKSYTLEEDRNLPKFNGGLVGYFSYDCVRYIEKKLIESVPPDSLGTPDALFMVSEDVAVFDNVKNKLHLIILIDSEDDRDIAERRLDELEEKLKEPLKFQDFKKPEKTINESDFISGFGEYEFKKSVEKAKKYIEEGDIMQVVCSQRMSIPFTADPVALYRSIRQLNPSPYMYYLNLHDFHIVGSSPEILARLEDNKVTVRPIAGTRRRGKDDADDIAMEKDMVNDPKEIAEHLMLIDLGRNDVGKISKMGTVKVSEKMVIEKYSHVMHIVSNVEGSKKENLSFIDVLKSALPAGTLSGAPKIRAMEIINELEPSSRGIYGGAIGHISWDGDIDTAIAIRTAVIKNNKIHVGAGAGVVADSIPENEWNECLQKAHVFLDAIEMIK